MLDTTPTRDRVAAMTAANISALVDDHRHDVRQAPVVLADPPWATLDSETLVRLPVADLAAADAVLVIWSPNSRIADAIAAVAAWGFCYRYLMQSDLRATSPTEHEYVIVGTRGAMPAPAQSVLADGFEGMHVERVFASTEKPAPWTARSGQDLLF